MLREPDNSMTSISSSPTGRSELFTISAALRGFQASDTQPPIRCSGQNFQEGRISLNRAFSPDVRRQVESGLRQRCEAIAVCLDEFVHTGRVPASLSRSTASQHLWKQLDPLIGCAHRDIPWTWFSSTDLHVAHDGQLTVMDQNLSLPSGFDRVTGTHDQTLNPSGFFRNAPGYGNEHRLSTTVVLSPDSHGTNARSCELLAQNLHAHASGNRDLIVLPDGVYLIRNRQRMPIETVIRRVRDELLDPNCFRPDSLVGLPGLFQAWKKGLVNVASPPGTQIAGCRVFGNLVPEMIREYLGELPQLDSPQILMLSEDREFRQIVRNIEEYSIRTDDPYHPARPFFGRAGRAPEFADVLRRVRQSPHAYVARRLLPADQETGFNLRVFATNGSQFQLLDAAWCRKAQPDGGAPPEIF